jgi:hypothetical protein
MADAELLRHQRTWQGFTTLVKIGTIGIILLVVILDLTLVH